MKNNSWKLKACIGLVGICFCLSVFGQLSILPQVPAAPSNLTAKSASSTQIDLAWKDNSANETNFKIYRSTAGGPDSLIATVAANVTSYSDKTVVINKTYTYRLSAVNAGGSSPWSNTATTTVVSLMISK